MVSRLDLQTRNIESRCSLCCWTDGTSEVCCSSLLHNHLRLRLAKYMRYSKSQNR